MRARAIAVGVLAATLAVGPPSPASNTFVGRPGRIAFSRVNEDFTRFGIRTIRKDGSGIRRLTRKVDGAPTWSPDGSRLAFIRTKPDGITRMMVMNADGTGVHPIGTPSRGYSEGCAIQAPKWSYDGLFIAYADDCFDAVPRVAQLRVAVADGSAEIQITDYGSLNHMGSQPWSPNLEESSQLVFTSNADGDNEVFVTNSDGTDKVQLTQDEVDQFEPGWSPAGGLIAFSTQTVQGNNPFNTVYTVPPTGGDATPIVEGDPHADTQLWSPDGSHLLVARRTVHGVPTAIVVGSDGGNEVVLGEGLEPADAAWSPSGNAIVFSRNGNLVRVRLSDLDRKALTSGGAFDSGGSWQAKPQG